MPFWIPFHPELLTCYGYDNVLFIITVIVISAFCSTPLQRAALPASTILHAMPVKTNMSVPFLSLAVIPKLALKAQQL